MRGLLAFVGLAIVMLPGSACAAQPSLQTNVPTDGRLRAVEAVLEHRIVMLEDTTTLMDACSVQLVLGDGAVAELSERARRLVRPDTVQSPCVFSRLPPDRSRRLLLESIAGAGDTLVVRAAFIHGELTHAQHYTVVLGLRAYVTEQRLSGFMRASPPPPPIPPEP